MCFQCFSGHFRPFRLIFCLFSLPGRAAFDKVMLSKSYSRQEKERREILDALRENDMEITKTAGSLCVSRSTLWRKMKKYGITVN